METSGAIGGFAFNAVVVRVALDRQTRKTPEPLETLKRYKEQLVDQWRQQVVSCRVDISAPLSSSAKAERAQNMSQFVQEVRMSLTVQERCAVTHLKKPRFIAHMQFVEGMSKTEAEARWTHDIDNPATKRNGFGPDIEVPVVLPRVTEVIRAKKRPLQVCPSHILSPVSRYGQCHQAVAIQCRCSELDQRRF